MAVQLIPVFAIAFVAAHMRLKKRRPKSRAIIVIQGATADRTSLEVGEKLSIQFLEEQGEKWKMTDAPDGFLLGSVKLEWEPAPGEKRLKAFNFAARRPGKTKAEFVKFVEGGDPNGTDCSKIEIEVI